MALAALAAVLPVAAYAQRTVPPPPVAAGDTALPPSRAQAITVALVRLPPADTLERLSALARMDIVWDPAVLRGDERGRALPPITCRLEGAAPEAVLRCITREAGLDFYRLSSGTYVIVRSAAEAPGFTTLAGVVVDSATGAPIVAARVRLADDALPRLTSDGGSFSFDRLLPGRYDVVVQALGYRPRRMALEVAEHARLQQRVVLAPVVAVQTPIVVNGIVAGSASGALAAASLSDREAAALVSAPSLFLPGGVQVLGLSRRDGTGAVHLQGGDVGEHQWRLDGIPLFDPAALSGLVGAVAPTAIGALEVRRAGFRAAAGSWTAGALDLSHALGDPAPGARAVVHADPLATSARLATPVAAGRVRGRAMVAGRLGNWGWAAPPALTRAMRAWNAPDPVLLHRLGGLGALGGMENLDVASFASTNGDDDVRLRDLHAATRLELPGFRQLELSAFGTQHALDRRGAMADSLARALRTRESYEWTTNGAQAAYRSFLWGRVAQRLQLRAVEHALHHHSAMSMVAPTVASMSGDERNRVRELALAADWQLTGRERWELSTGVELADTRATLDLVNRVLRPLLVDTRVARATLYGDATWRLGSGTWLETGLRISQLETGRTYAEPRVALRGEGSAGAERRWAWRLAGGGYHQFVNQFDVATTSPVGLVPSVRFWLPADGRQGVPQAWHLAAEGVLTPAAGWEVRAEGYAKWQPTLLAFDYGALFAADGSHASAVPLRSAGDFVRAARGDAFGAGVRATWDGTAHALPWRVELGYDATLARRTAPSRFGGTRQAVPWLEPHRAVANVEWLAGSGRVVSARARGVWGRPWALRQAFYDLFGATPAGSGLPIDAPGAMRRPALVEVDLGGTQVWRLGRTRVEVGASVTNLLDRRNVLDYGLRRDVNAARYVMVPRFLPGRQPALTLRLVP